MPGRRASKARAFGPWADPDFVPPPPPRSKKHRRTRHKKRFHHAFRVLIALGLVPTKSRQCDPLGLRLNRMHVMDTECEKIGGGGCLTAESAPELAAKPNESLLVVDDAKTTSTSTATTTSSQAVVNKVQQEAAVENENNLVNGTSGDHQHHHCTDDVGGSMPAMVIDGDEDTAADKHNEMEVVEDEEDEDDDEDDGVVEELTASGSITAVDAVESSEAGELNVVQDEEEDEVMDVDMVKGTKENLEQVDDEEDQIEEENNEEEILAVEGDEEEIEEEEEEEQEEMLLGEGVKEDGQQTSALSSNNVTQSVCSAVVMEEPPENSRVTTGGGISVEEAMSAGSKDEEETLTAGVSGVVEEDNDEDELLMEGEEEEFVDSAGAENATGKEAMFVDNEEEDEEEEEEQEQEDVPEEEQSEDVDHQDLIMTSKKTVLGNGSVSIEITKEKTSSALTSSASIMATANSATLPTSSSLQQQKQLQTPVAVSTTTANSATSVVLVAQQPAQQQAPAPTPIPPPTQSLLSSALTTPSAVTSSSSCSSLTTITIESAPAPILPTTSSSQVRKERLIIIDDAKVTNLKVEPKCTVNNASSMAAAISSLPTSLTSQLSSVTPTAMSLLTAAVTASRGDALKEDHATITAASTSSSSGGGGGVAASSGSAIVIPINEDDDCRASIRAAAFSIASKLHSQKEAEKRKITGLAEKETEGEVSSGSESDTSRKKIKVEPDLETANNTSNSNNNNNNINNNNNEQHHSMPPTRSDHQQLQQHIVDDDRERYIQDFIAQCSQNVEEMDRAAERLHKEVETLVELARAKELEWNAIVRVRKMREEMLERLLRKRRLATEDFVVERTHLENSLHKNVNKCQGNNQLMMVPIVSSSPGAMMSNRGPPPVRLPPEYSKQQRPILPKPYANMVDPNCTTREGRNGPIVDVKSIIADYSSGYRSRHPENVPRRGRRMRGGPIIEPPPNRMSANPSLISMANMALGSGASIRTISDSPYNLSQDHSRPSSTDPTRGGQIEGGTNMGYKDVLVQFAKMTSHGGVGVHGGKGPPPNGVQPQPQPPPPPYPEVTLHPVSRPGSSPPTPASSSLLHGILTKSNNAMSPAAAAAAAVAAARPPANFSPTLARLLTAPDRPPHPIQPPPHFRPQHPPRVSIADILSSSKKSRNEITITPVSGNPTVVNKPKEDVVLLQDDDETEGSDRLVIDESADNEEIPQCQGCRQKPAQFVCAGCGNQWYCSRECQVTAWEEHSDVCSG